MAFLTCDDEHHRFALVNLDVLQGSETEKQGLIGIDHVAYTYSSLEELFENYEQLQAKSITSRSTRLAFTTHQATLGATAATKNPAIVLIQRAQAS